MGMFFRRIQGWPERAPRFIHGRVLTGALIPEPLAVLRLVGMDDSFRQETYLPHEEDVAALCGMG